MILLPNRQRWPRRMNAVAVLLLMILVPGCKSSRQTTELPIPASHVLISNLNGNDYADVSFYYDQGRSIAVGFKMPDRASALASISLRLRTGEAPVPDALVVRLYNNDSNGNPGQVLLTFQTPSIPANLNPPQPIAFLPESPYTLEPNTTYWIVAYYTGPDLPGWTCGNPSTAPTGVATHVGAKWDLNVLPGPPTTSRDQICQYAVIVDS
jgi:hypothetical protein